MRYFKYQSRITKARVSRSKQDDKSTKTQTHRERNPRVAQTAAFTPPLASKLMTSSSPTFLLHWPLGLQDVQPEGGKTTE